jgi:Cytochrome P460
MTPAKVAALAAPATIFAFALSIGAQADATKVAFPSDYTKSIKWLILDKEPQKQVHEIYAPPAAFEAARKGEAMPDGAVFVVVRYSAKLDDQDNPIKDENGRLTKGEILSFNVMQKGKGWGSEYPDTLRNGEWEYRAFNADHTPNNQARLTACFECHKSQESHDFVHGYEKLTTAVK